MSLERHVFFRGPLADRSALASALGKLGFPFVLTPGDGPLEGQSGFMPMSLESIKTGVELDLTDRASVVEDLAMEETDGIDPRFDRCVALRWGGDEMELLSALCVSAALVTVVDGVVFDPEGGSLLTNEQAFEEANRFFQSVR